MGLFEFLVVILLGMICFFLWVIIYNITYLGRRLEEIRDKK